MGVKNKSTLVLVGLIVLLVILNMVSTIGNAVNQRKINSLEASVLILQKAVMTLQLKTLGDQSTISPAERIGQCKMPI